MRDQTQPGGLIQRALQGAPPAGGGGAGGVSRRTDQAGFLLVPKDEAHRLVGGHIRGRQDAGNLQQQGHRRTVIIEAISTAAPVQVSRDHVHLGRGDGAHLGSVQVDTAGA